MGRNLWDLLISAAKTSWVYSWLLLLCALFSSGALAAPRLIAVEFSVNATQMPTGASGIIPALYVKYGGASKLYRTVLFDQTLPALPGQLSRRIYLPLTVQWIEPLLVFQRNGGGTRYWHCKEKRTATEIPDAAVAKLQVVINTLPSNAMPPAGQTGQQLSCTYQTVSA